MFLKKYYLTLLLLAFTAFSCKNDDDIGSNTKTNTNTNTEAVGITDTVKTFGGSKNDSAKKIIATTDGGYAIIGYTQSIDGDIKNKTQNNYDYLLLKFNENNTLEWSKTYGGTEDDRGQDVVQTEDGGYAVIGYTNSKDGDVTKNAGQSDFWFAKLDSKGTLLWEKSFGYIGTDTGAAVLQTKDGGYLLTGTLDVTASNGAGNTFKLKTQHAGGDYWAIKLNATGTIEWSKYYGGLFSDTLEDVVETDDNGYILVGTSDSEDTDISSNIGSYDYWVVKISNTGSIVWEKNFGGTGTENVSSITKSGDGNYIIVGDTRSDDKQISKSIGAADLWLIKISPAGELLWEKSIGGTGFDVARDVTKTKDGGFLMAGSSRSDDGDVKENKGQNDAWVLKVDSNGKLLWQTTAGGTHIDFAYSAVELNNKKIVAVGETRSVNGDLKENKGYKDLLIINIK